jgi:hypothetical protein
MQIAKPLGPGLPGSWGRSYNGRLVRCVNGSFGLAAGDYSELSGVKIWWPCAEKRDGGCDDRSRVGDWLARVD